MSVSLGGGRSKSKSSSKALTAEQVQEYWDQVDSNSGGRLNSFAKNGTAETNYSMLSADDIRAVGGMGESQRNQIQTGLDNQLNDLNDDASITTSQRIRATQLANESASGALNAVNKESEALATQILEGQNSADYQARLRNSQLTREDLESLSAMFFGGKGQNSSSKSSSWNMSGSVGAG
jgi:hypothetical protein